MDNNSNNQMQDMVCKRYRYGLYGHKLTAPDGAPYTRSLIFLRNEYGDVVRFTRLHQFAGTFADKVYAPITSDGKERLYHICSMLNYVLIEQYAKFEIDHIFHIDYEAVMCFFQSYAYELSSDGKFRSRASIERCVENITAFFHRLKRYYGSEVLLDTSELYTEKIIFSKTGRRILKKSPIFQVKGIAQYREIFRDIPTKVFKILLNLAFRYTPDIAFAICLQAFAGLRAGEVCNVRQEGSPLGSGLIFTKMSTAVKKIEIDVTREIQLRSDRVSVGRIKKERKQCVYPPFIKAFCAAYEHHKKFLAERTFETDYAPMFVTSKGLAMTYKVYQERFYSLVDNHLRQELLHSGDSECVVYGQLLYENRLGLHSLRHWFGKATMTSLPHIHISPQNGIMIKTKVCGRNNSLSARTEKYGGSANAGIVGRRWFTAVKITAALPVRETYLSPGLMICLR